MSLAMRYGEKGHSVNVHFERFAYYVKHHMEKHPKHMWRKIFNQLTENTNYNVKEIREFIWEKMKQ